MGNSIKVETDMLASLATQYRNHANDYKNVCDKIANAMKKYGDVWQGSFAKDFESDLNRLSNGQKSVYENCIGLATFLDQAVKTYIDVDRGAIPRENVDTREYPAGVDVSIRKDQILSDIWREWGDYSPNRFTNINGKGNCTWYADWRYQQMNPDHPLKFNWTGNAKMWDDGIDRNYFDVKSAYDSNNIESNTIAVSEKGQYGHVAYVERVRDGMVYYTEDGEAYTRPHTWAKDANGNWLGPKVQCCTVDEFKTKFSKIIKAK